MVSSDATTFNLIGSQRRESDFGDVHIYDASSISHIVPYGIVEEHENTSAQENVFLSSGHWAQGNWNQDSELTSDYGSFAVLIKEDVSHAAIPPRAAIPWGLVASPASFKGTITGVSDMRLLNAMHGWRESKPKAAEKESPMFTIADATIRWNPSVSPSLLKAATIANMLDTQLRDALHDWNRVKHEAAEEGYPIPTDIALENSRRVLISMYSISPRRFEVYPTPDGEVAIDMSGGFRRSILLLCDSDGSALCLVNINGEFRRAHYSDMDKLPDGFIREALTELEQTDNTIK